MQPQRLIKQHNAGRRHHLEIWIVNLNRTRILYVDNINIVPGLWLSCSSAALSSSVLAPGKLACAVRFREDFKFQTFFLYSPEERSRSAGPASPMLPGSPSISKLSLTRKWRGTVTKEPAEVQEFSTYVPVSSAGEFWT